MVYFADRDRGSPSAAWVVFALLTGSRTLRLIGSARTQIPGQRSSLPPRLGDALSIGTFLRAPVLGPIPSESPIWIPIFHPFAIDFSPFGPGKDDEVCLPYDNVLGPFQTDCGL